MASLFEPATINSVTVRNRFVRSATWEGLAADDGSVTDRLVAMYDALAAGGVGLIITGHAYVSKQGQACPWQLAIDADRQIVGLSRLADTVHRYEGRIMVQLAHAGCRAPVALTGVEPIGPSVISGESGQACRAMDGTDITVVIDSFARAAGRAQQAGCDGVQIHAAHSYLVSEFLSPCHNQRLDAYGGAIENRTRLLLDIIAAVRSRTGPDFAVLVKINSDDFIPGGFSPDDMLQAAALMENSRVDAIELSGGSPFSTLYTATRPGPIKNEADEVYYRAAARRYKQRIRVPLILPGGIRSFGVARELVEQGITDFVSMSRPFIREPALVNRWQSGDLRKAACLSDNLCLDPLRKGEGLYCVVAQRESMSGSTAAADGSGAAPG